MAWSGHHFRPGRSATSFTRSPSTELKNKLGLNSGLFSQLNKLVFCSECGSSHRPCSPCKYVAAAKAKCLSLGVSPLDFKLHLDQDLIDSDNLAYLDESCSESVESTADVEMLASISLSMDSGFGPSLEPAPAPEPTLPTEPASATDPGPATGPSSASQPALGAEPAPATQPAAQAVLATQPTLAAGSASATQPASATEPTLAAETVPAIRPAAATEPALAAEPVLDTRPTPASEPALAAKTVPATQPAAATEPALAAETVLVTQPVPSTQPSEAEEELPPWDRRNIHEQELFMFSDYKTVLNKSRIILRNNLRLADVWSHLQQMTVITQNDEERMRLNAPNCDSVDRLIAFIDTCQTWRYHALLRAMALTHQGHLIPQGGLAPEVYKQDVEIVPSSACNTSTATGVHPQKQHFYRKIDSEVKIPISADLLPGLLRHCEVSEQILMKADLFGFHEDITIDLTRYQICVNVKCIHNREEKMVKSVELFNRLFQRHAPNTVLLEGEAGSGKSTYLQDYAHRHCKEFIECEEKGAESPCLGHSWKLILYIPAGLVVGSQEAAILDNLHCEDKHKDQLMTMVKDEGEGVLIINDGLDELRKQVERENIRQYTIAHQKGGRPKVLNSSRNGLCCIEGKFFDRIVTLTGFSLNQGLDYVEQYFRESSSSDHSVLLEYIKQQRNKLEWVLTNPLRLHIFSELVLIGHITQEDLKSLTLAKMLKMLEAYVLRRDEKMCESETADTYTTDFYRLCLESFLADQREFSEQSIAESSPYKAFLKKDKTLTVFARERRYFTFGHQLFFEYFSVQGLINFMKSKPQSKNSLLLCLCADISMRNVLYLICGCIAEYEPNLHEDLVFILQACIILQVEEQACEKNKLMERLQYLPDVIKKNFTASGVYAGVGEGQAMMARDICKEIKAFFNENSDCLRTSCFFFNLYKTDIPGDMLRSPTHHLQFIIRCLRQCTPSLQDKVCSQTTQKLFPCVRYNMMDQHMNGDSYLFPVSGQRWCTVRDQGIEGGFLRFVSIMVWCPSDIIPALTQFYKHRNPAQPADGTPFLRTTYNIDISQASHLWGEPLNEMWMCEEWAAALVEVLKHRPSGINFVVGRWNHDAVPLQGLFNALRLIITPSNSLSLRGGIGVSYGQVNEGVLEEFYLWTRTVNLRVNLSHTRVLLSSDRDEDYVTRLHNRVMAMTDPDSPPCYMTPGGQTVEYRKEPVSSTRDRVLTQLMETIGLKTDDFYLGTNPIQPAGIEPSETLAEFEMD